MRLTNSMEVKVYIRRKAPQPAGALGRAHARGRVKDLPGIRYNVVRGARRRWVSDRKKARSQHGVKTM